MAVVKPVTRFYFWTCSKRCYSTSTLSLLCLVAKVKIFLYYSLKELDSHLQISDVPDVSKALLYVQTQCIYCHITEKYKNLMY